MEVRWQTRVHLVYDSTRKHSEGYGSLSKLCLTIRLVYPRNTASMHMLYHLPNLEHFHKASEPPLRTYHTSYRPLPERFQ